MLKIANVNKAFGGLQALYDVSLAVQKDRITSLIGPNGAGKTTLFNVITGAIPPDSGRIEFSNINIAGMKPYETCRMGIARTYQHKNLFPNLSVFENVYAGMLKDRIDRRKKEEEVYRILDSLKLSEKGGQIVSDLPPLDVKLVELGRSLATHPKLILLDELVGGLIATETERICEVIKILRNQDHTVFQISHEMGPIMNTSDWIIVLDKGSTLAQGTPEDVRQNETVQRAYLETDYV
jgi:branched-chain amino acid transport system ATP-binding protein